MYVYEKRGASSCQVDSRQSLSQPKKTTSVAGEDQHYQLDKIPDGFNSRRKILHIQRQTNTATFGIHREE